MRKPRRTNTPSQQPRPTDQSVPSTARDGHLQVEHHEAIWQGPLPPPAILEQFRELVPDAPERIFAQWEAEAAHRRSVETSAVRGALARERLGQIGAILFVVLALAVVALALWLDHPWIAGILGAGTITSVVGAFLYQRRTDP